MYFYFDPNQSYVEVRLPVTHWEVGGVLLIGIVTTLLGLIAMIACRISRPAFFTDRALRYGPAITDEGAVVEVKPPE
jgi:hypothetical protein